MFVIYVAGPYKGSNAWEIEKNIRHAEAYAKSIWQLGAVGLCPHTNNRFFYGSFSEDTAFRGCVELLHRSDAIFMCPGWEGSTGSKDERDEAMLLGIPVFYSLEGLAIWLKAAEQNDG